MSIDISCTHLNFRDMTEITSGWGKFDPMLKIILVTFVAVNDWIFFSGDAGAWFPKSSSKASYIYIAPTVNIVQCCCSTKVWHVWCYIQFLQGSISRQTSICFWRCQGIGKIPPECCIRGSGCIHGSQNSNRDR